MSGNNYLLSIVIPLYNGEEFLEDALTSMTSQISTNETEIVLCDDKSSDRTVEIAHRFAEKYDYIKLYHNEQNLGMDGNFERVANLAQGQFVWFSGQDDFFLPGAVDKVLEIIKNNSEINFIHMNFSQNSHNFDSVITKKMLDISEDRIFDDYVQYLEFVDLGKLPSFLPAFILEKALWDKVTNKKDFYKTCFVQLGIFFEVLKELKIYISAEPLVKGRVPDNKWQSDNNKLLDILSGDLEVITYAHKKLALIPAKLFKDHYKSRRKWLFNTLILAKTDKKVISAHIRQRFGKILSKKDFLITFVLLSIPDNLYQFQSIRKILRALR